MQVQKNDAELDSSRQALEDAQTEGNLEINELHDSAIRKRIARMKPFKMKLAKIVKE